MKSWMRNINALGLEFFCWGNGSLCFLHFFVVSTSCIISQGEWISISHFSSLISKKPWIEIAACLHGEPTGKMWINSFLSFPSIAEDNVPACHCCVCCCHWISPVWVQHGSHQCSCSGKTMCYGLLGAPSLSFPWVVTRKLRKPWRVQEAKGE